MPKKLVTGPTDLPLKLSEAKAQLEVDFEDDDQFITSLIRVVTADAENYLRRALLTQTWDFYIDRFSDYMDIPLPALQSIESVKYIDTNGDQQTLDAATYDVDTYAEPGVVRLAFGKSWPSTRDEANAVTIRFVCGYTSANEVPMPIKQAMLLQLRHLYEQRDTIIKGTIVKALPAYMSMMEFYRVY
jgi:uncharacterized phiE125 gp8 family phage protein